MAARTVTLLHVEDDLMQRELTAHQLATLPDYSFVITPAESEDAAVSEFGRSRQEIVILDYHLAQGNGLSCLRKIRAMDTIVPIIALSGKATPEIAAELLKAGADNYLSKKDLATETLTGSVAEALARADAWRRHAPPGDRQAARGAQRQAQDIFKSFAVGSGPELLRQLDAFETAARQGNLELRDLQQWFEQAAGELAGPHSAEHVQRLLRPMLLEMLVRLRGEGAGIPAGRSDTRPI